MLKCPKCNTLHQDNTQFCNICGTSLSTKTLQICPSCGAELPNADSKFCVNCSTKFDTDNKPIEKVLDYHIHICPKCGHTLEDNSSKFCLLCGNNFAENPALTWSDNKKFYRMCTHCGRSHVIDENDIRICKKCGRELDLTPRLEPKLTDDEQQSVDAILAQERELNEIKRKAEEEQLALECKQREEEQQKQEAEEKQRQTELARIKAEKIRKYKKFFKATGIVIVTCSALVLIGTGVWKFSEKSFISNGDKALAQGDYNTAISYYKKVFPIGSTHNVYEQKIVAIANAGALYEDAKVQFNNNSYLNAMSKSKEALNTCSELTVAQDLYTQSQNKLGEYLQKLFDEKNYADLYTAIKNINEDCYNEKITTIETSLDNIIQSYIDKGNTYLKSENYAEAISSANEVLNISPDISEALTLKNDVANAYVTQGRQELNTYNSVKALESANNALSIINDYSDAKQLIEDINTFNSYVESISAFYTSLADNTTNNINLLSMIMGNYQLAVFSASMSGYNNANSSADLGATMYNMEIFQEKLGYRVGYDEMDNRINKLSDEYKNIPTPPENCTNGQTLINQLYDYNIQIHELSGETAISNTGYTDYANKGQSLINSTQETNKKVKEFITSIGGTISN